MVPSPSEEKKKKMWEKHSDSRVAWELDPVVALIDKPEGT